MDPTRRAELIELAAKRQFKADYPGRVGNCVQESSAEMDKRALYLFQAVEYLITNGVITAPVDQAA
jgi:hypothetical protein